ncbi:MAG: DNA ligase D [Gemmatimonadales bacterium]
MPKKVAAKADRLTSYRVKRKAGATPEPAGVVERSEGRLFVVHKHAARRMHYDLRLEMGGVLQSWAVPKGPSRDPKEKRLAVKVEDHPLEYGDFEGVIPEGNYGAGAVILWDRGLWVPLRDVEEGFAKGKLLFELRGYKLRGRWTLVRIKKSEKEWLLIKERDSVGRADQDEFPEGSVLSGLTVEELRDGVDVGRPIRDELEHRGAPRRRVNPEKVEVMLAETRERPFSKPGWIYELKFDGYRIIASMEGGEARLFTRSGRDATATFPEVARALEALRFEQVVMDGEVIVHDESGMPSFQRLQQRAQFLQKADIRRASVEYPATLYAFDLLAFDGYDARGLPLSDRRSLLRRVLPEAGPLRFSDHIEEEGEEFYKQVTGLGLEGIVAKKADSPYLGGRSSSWIKVRADRTADFVVVGLTAPKGSRKGFGALHLAAFKGESLVYAGRVGSGFSSRQLAEVRDVLLGAERREPACERAPQGKEDTWVEPALVVEVRYKEITHEGLLRQPVFVRFRNDKAPDECEVPRSGKGGTEGGGLPELSFPTSRFPSPDEVQLTNLDKVFWKDEGYTKGDLVEYYRAVAGWMLPYLRDRPLVMTRYPDGIHGKSFYQKDAPGFAPEWLRTETVWSDSSERELEYFVADHAASLLYIANLGTIPIHVWASRVASLEHPDWCVLDLDPKDARFEHVVRVARTLHRLCDEIGLPNYVKTTGKSGLHVLIPLGRLCTYEQSRTLGHLLARVVVAELPEIATITRVISQREGKVYVDYLQNRRGQLIVAPYSVRPMRGATVSTPLSWREVTVRLDIKRYTIKTVPVRLKRMKQDPFAGVLREKPDLLGALEELNKRLK